jgi:hypothetical protein
VRLSPKRALSVTLTRKIVTLRLAFVFASGIVLGVISHRLYAPPVVFAPSLMRVIQDPRGLWDAH